MTEVPLTTFPPWRLMRLWYGLSQAELARRAGVDKSAVSRFETGSRNTASVRDRIIKVLRGEEP